METVKTLGTAVTENELVERSQYPRVTKEALEANIAGHTFDYLGLLVKCTITLQNGFMVSGESACAVPGNYKKDVGERLAFNDAKSQIWKLMGYELKTKVAIAQEAGFPDDTDMKVFVGTKALFARPMSLGVYNVLRGWTIPDDEDPAREGYYVEYPDGHKSWSPKEVFDASYEQMDLRGEGSTGGPTWQDRLEIEIDQLQDRLHKLVEMIEGPLFNSLPDVQRQLLTEQVKYMTGYLSALLARQTA